MSLVSVAERNGYELCVRPQNSSIGQQELYASRLSKVQEVENGWFLMYRVELHHSLGIISDLL